jgi:hypothetical protein
MTDVIKDKVKPYFPRNIADPVRAKYIDSNILPASIINIIDQPQEVYNILYYNTVLRNKILNFHKRIERTSNISLDVRLKCAHIIPWTSGMNTKCITCNEEVDLLYYSVLNISKYRIILDISKQINAEMNQNRINNCCPRALEFK